MTSIFRLSASLEGHTQDVRGVVFPNEQLVVSCSRDGTVRTWKRKEGGGFEDHVNSAASCFVNSVAWIPGDGGLIASGSQDTIIDVRPPFGDVSADAKILLLGHTQNVCALDYYNGVLVSGSWDGKARVWKDGETKQVLEGHTAAVWGVLVLESGEIVTASGDRTIRIWKNGSTVKTITAHSDAVRGLCRLPSGGFASCSNDSSIRLWTADGQELAQLYGHTAFIYSVAALPNGDLVSSGEDRTVRIWRGTECIQTITHPAISVWTVAVCPENGDIVSGASDGIVRVFTRSEERLADAETIKKFDNLVAASAIPSNQVGDVNKEKLPGPELLEKPGNKEGQVVMIKRDDNVEAHSWSSATRSWTFIGTVVDAVGSNRKQTWEGQEYDYVFDVDIQEGAPPLKLPFNLKDNPYEAATKFLQRNKLDVQYAQTVAEFILKNTKGQTIGQSVDEAPDAWGTQNRYRPGQASGTAASSAPAQPSGNRLLPHTKYLAIAAISPVDLGKAKKKLGEFNEERVKAGEKEDALNPTEEAALGELFSILEKCPKEKPEKGDVALAEGLEVLIKILTTWPPQQRIVALDLLRLLAAYSEDVATLEPTGDDTLLDLLETIDAFNPAYKPNLMLTIRIFVNLFSTAPGVKLVGDNSSRIYSLIDKALSSIDAPSKPIKTAHITLVLNYSILFCAQRNTVQAAGLVDLLTGLLKNETDAEVIYRGLIAIGNVLSLGDATTRVVARGSGTQAVVSEAASRSGEERAGVVLREILALL